MALQFYKPYRVESMTGLPTNAIGLNENSCSAFSWDLNVDSLIIQSLADEAKERAEGQTMIGVPARHRQ